jgi:hypothetical protein
MPPKLPKGKWSWEYDCCQRCGTTSIKHYGKGYCVKCQAHLRWLQRSGKTEEDMNRWSLKHDCCIGCGTTSIPHEGLGYCKKCYSHLLSYEEQKEKWPCRNPDQVNKARKERINRNRDPTIHIREYENSKRMVAKYPEKQSARHAVFFAVRDGKLIRPTVCPRCGKSNVQIDAHHYLGYDHPLDVIWLCHACHMKEEKNANKLR